MKQRALLTVSLNCVVLVALTGCSSSSTKTAQQRNIGMANPASVYCLAQKGRLDSVSTTLGVSSFCTLPNGERIEEWALFHRDHPQQ
ncbi:DUF333 domain-containing protein [Rosenbergiella australiborealis]|uniref:putative hemolysin n=1 Tax=Rosenbergiella australiborealis TaxID=1544696 RepID=UPI001F4E296F|nr:DUF333 domain-containing protein [Rosenbergiella australiborealis]